jgi:hypothetical protein
MSNLSDHLDTPISSAVLLPASRDFTDQTIGCWKVLRFHGYGIKPRGTRWICQCACGTIRSVPGDTLNRKSSTSCGRCHFSLSFLKTKFESKLLIVESGCWEWQGTRHPQGYGRLWAQGKRVSSHILAYQIYKGQTEGLDVCHHCDNPPCCNPDHLFLGTHQDNMQDMIQKGRSNHPKGQDCGTAKLSDSQVIAIRAAYSRGQISLKTLAGEYEMSLCAIQAITSGKTWKHLLPANEPKNPDNSIVQDETGLF